MNNIANKLIEWVENNGEYNKNGLVLEMEQKI